MQSLPPNVAGGVVYQPAGPPSYPGTFSPAGSVEGSPMHMNYMNQPGQTGGPYQAMPPTGEEHHTPLKAGGCFSFYSLGKARAASEVGSGLVPCDWPICSSI